PSHFRVRDVLNGDSAYLLQLLLHYPPYSHLLGHPSVFLTFTAAKNHVVLKIAREDEPLSLILNGDSEPWSPPRRHGPPPSCPPSPGPYYSHCSGPCRTRCPSQNPDP